MKFAEIIRNADIALSCPARFEKIRSIDINLYDGKDRISNDKTIEFVEPLFKENPDAYANFYAFIVGLENDKDIPAEMNVKIDISAVILFYKTPRAIAFLRKPPMDPMDYME